MLRLININPYRNLFATNLALSFSLSGLGDWLQQVDFICLLKDHNNFLVTNSYG